MAIAVVDNAHAALNYESWAMTDFGNCFGSGGGNITGRMNPLGCGNSGGNGSSGARGPGQFGPGRGGGGEDGDRSGRSGGSGPPGGDDGPPHGRKPATSATNGDQDLPSLPLEISLRILKVLSPTPVDQSMGAEVELRCWRCRPQRPEARRLLVRTLGSPFGGRGDDRRSSIRDRVSMARGGLPATVPEDQSQRPEAIRRVVTQLLDARLWERIDAVGAPLASQHRRTSARGAVTGAEWPFLSDLHGTIQGTDVRAS